MDQLSNAAQEANERNHVITHVIGCLFFCASELEKMGYMTLSLALVDCIDAINSNLKAKLH